MEQSETGYIAEKKVLNVCRHRTFFTGFLFGYAMGLIGILVSLTFYRMRKGKQVALGALVISILIEAAQYVFQCGKTEVDEVI